MYKNEYQGYGASYRRVEKFAAQRMGVTPEHVSMLLTYVWEGIANEMSRGHSVHIRGFGQFFVNVYGPKKKSLPLRVAPRWVPAIHLRSEIAAHCSIGMVKDRSGKRQRNYEKNNHISKDKHGVMRTLKNVDQQREKIRKDARALGQDL